MPRPKAADPANVDFHVRTTRGEADALGEVIARWADEMRGQGLPVPADKTAWFRALVRREASRLGIAVADPPPVERAPARSFAEAVGRDEASGEEEASDEKPARSFAGAVKKAAKKGAARRSG